MSDCNRQCGSCGEQGCAGRTGGKPDFRVNPHPKSRVGKVIDMLSGKGGVGKSLVTSLTICTYINPSYTLTLLF
jgi:hypothetical protein